MLWDIGMEVQGAFLTHWRNGQNLNGQSQIQSEGGHAPSSATPNSNFYLLGNLEAHPHTPKTGHPPQMLPSSS